MQMNDMILVSVDDHLIEPPDMFTRHLPARFSDPSLGRDRTSGLLWASQ